MRHTSAKGRARSMYGSRAIFTAGALSARAGGGGRAREPVLATRHQEALRFSEKGDLSLALGLIPDRRERLDPRPGPVDDGEDGVCVGGGAERPICDLD